MQPEACSTLLKNARITVVIILYFYTGILQAGQFTYTTPANSSGNNFTMLDRNPALVDGTNDVVFTWDGTLNDAVAGAVSNATISSDQAFFGSFWDAHDVMMYGPGTYTVYDGCPPGDPACGTGNEVTFTVDTGQIGAHMLFDWPAGAGNNIDVVNVWNKNLSWEAQNPTNPFHAGPDDGTSCSGPSTDPTNCVVDGLPNTVATVFDFISTDVNGDGIAGLPMTDGSFPTFNASFNINGINFPPVASDFNVGALIDTPKLIDLAANATDPEGTLDPGSATIVPASGPANGTLVNNGDGTVLYTPDLGFESPPTDSFEYTIDDSDGATSNIATVTITVSTAINNPPVASDAAFDTDEDTSLDIEVNSVASDPDPSDTLTFATFDTASAQGGSVTANGSKTVLTYTPLPDFSGADTFTYSVTDGIDNSNTATITVTVNPINDALVCTDVGLSTGIDEVLTIDVANDLLSTCSDIEDNPITFVSASQPTQPGSTVSFDGANTLTYTPPPGFSGEDTFTYTATDGTDTDTRTVIVSIGKILGNFSMLDSAGKTIGGTNDIASDWDGTLNNAVTDTNFNMSIASDSDQPFNGFTWDAHNIRVFGPGSYSFDTSCSTAQIEAGTAVCGGGPFLDLTVSAGQLGAHVLFDWNVSANIDVVLRWDADGSWENADPLGQLYQGPAGPTPALDSVYDFISRDVEGDGVPGAKMVDGSFIGFRANFNLCFAAGCPSGAGIEVDVPRATVSSPSLGGQGCSLGNATTGLLSRSDWLVISGFMVWLGLGASRRRHQKPH